MSIHTSHKALITQFFSLTVISLSVGLMAIGSAHAEQYCKSIDKDGNATYTLASDKGCNAKKMKTVAVSHHITPAAPAAPKPAAVKANAEASSTAPAPAATSTAPAAPSIGAAPTANTSKSRQTPNM